MKKKASMVCAVIALIGAIVVGILIANYVKSAKESEDKMEALRVEAEWITPTAQTPSESMAEKDNPYATLFAENEDMAAWLTIADTKIDYPVMQTMENETYYIDKDFYGNYDKAGCLLLDTDSSLTQDGTTNLIIHGHNMKAGTMFGELELYKDADYGMEHNRMVLYTQEDKREYEVIAVFYSQVYYATDQVFKYYNFFEAESEEEFRDFYENIKELSLYDTGVTAQLGDKFLTLSTCSYHVEDGRFVVVAKEVTREEVG